MIVKLKKNNNRVCTDETVSYEPSHLDLYGVHSIGISICKAEMVVKLCTCKIATPKKNHNHKI